MHRFLTVLLLFAVLSLGAGVELKGNFNWDKRDKVKTVCPGVVYTEFKLTSPRLIRAAAVRVDLGSGRFGFKMTPRDRDWGKPMPDYPKGIIRTRRVTCRKFMEDAVKNGENMVVSVNGSPWGPFHAPWTFKYAGNQGLIVSDGQLVAEIRKGRPSFVVYKDGTMEFKLFAPGDDISSVQHAISGFGFVLRDGKLTPKDNPRAKLAPRTGYGLSKDKRYMYIVAIDGRQPGYSMGASTYEVGQFLLHLGAYSGLNMDGGGSTTLIVREKHKLRKLNSHALGAERAVGGAMGIILK
ncbi:MAG: phosphodiester glycosidase family protein [Lentisphaerae bacterium]|nr:phosphodiester glycosidase family protein [Lentisphaerota bacterium]